MDVWLIPAASSVMAHPCSMLTQAAPHSFVLLPASSSMRVLACTTTFAPPDCLYCRYGGMKYVSSSDYYSSSVPAPQQ